MAGGSGAGIPGARDRTPALYGAGLRLEEGHGCGEESQKGRIGPRNSAQGLDRNLHPSLSGTVPVDPLSESLDQGSSATDL